MNVTDEPKQTDVVLAKFMNGFINGYILENNWISNVEEGEGEENFLISVWQHGVGAGRFYRFRRNN